MRFFSKPIKAKYKVAPFALMAIALLFCYCPQVTLANEKALLLKTKTNSPAVHFSLSQMAQDGRVGDFAGVLAQLKASKNAIDNKKVASLIASIKHFDKHKKASLKQRKKDYQKALDKIAKDIKNNNLENGLVQALKAKQLAISKEKLLSSAIIINLSSKASLAADKACQQNKWAKALSLYEQLNRLHKIEATYLKDMKKAQHHVQVLKVYAPKKLEKIYKKRAEKKSNNDKLSSDSNTNPKTKIEQEAIGVAFDTQPWQSRLKNIDFDLLDQVLVGAATRHIAPQGYKPVILGAINALKIMIDTPQIYFAFPGLEMEKKRASFRFFLNKKIKQLKQENKISNSYARAIIASLRDKNSKTVNLPSNVLAYELAQGATNTLDRFSRVIWPSQVSLFSRTMSGSFSGVGIQVSMRDGKLTVISPLYGTPAANSGVLAGDVISKVNGKKTLGWSLNHAIRKITGPTGSKVNLGLSRKGHKKLIHVTLKRKKIAIKSVLGWAHTKKDKWDYFIAPKFRIGYVQITQFIPQTPKDLDKAIKQMQSSGKIGGLILDLRYNPGGLLSSGAQVADRFISRGPLVFTVDAKKHHNSVLKAHKGDTYKHFPVVVLINGSTASAAEIVTGALQSYARALVVGTRSFGKGSVQDLFPVDNGKAFFKLTTQHYMLPLGQIIHRFTGAKKWGIDPDIKVITTQKQSTKAQHLRQRANIMPGSQIDTAKPLPSPNVILKKGLDPQLQAAILVLKTNLLAANLSK